MLGAHPVLGLPFPFAGSRLSVPAWVNAFHFIWNPFVLMGVLLCTASAAKGRDAKGLGLVLLPLALPSARLAPLSDGHLLLLERRRRSRLDGLHPSEEAGENHPSSRRCGHSAVDGHGVVLSHAALLVLLVAATGAGGIATDPGATGWRQGPAGGLRPARVGGASRVANGVVGSGGTTMNRGDACEW